MSEKKISKELQYINSFQENYNSNDDEYFEEEEKYIEDFIINSIVELKFYIDEKGLLIGDNIDFDSFKEFFF